MPFTYKHVLLVGATAGIGRAMADRFIAEGVKVTAVGRRQERLNEFVSSHGSDKASSIAFDISQLDKIPAFVNGAMKAHPSIDCVFLNAGTQTHADFSKPETVDLEAFHREITINFSSFVALTHAVLPHLLARKAPTSLVFTGSPIGFIPFFKAPSYSSSKCALDTFIICIREQLRDTNVQVMHISPGPVQTELHGASGGNFGMPLEDFVDVSWAGLAAGQADTFPGCVGGSTKEQFLEVVDKREEAFVRLTGLVRSLAKK